MEPGSSSIWHCPKRFCTSFPFPFPPSLHIPSWTSLADIPAVCADLNKLSFFAQIRREVTKIWDILKKYLFHWNIFIGAVITFAIPYGVAKLFARIRL